ncbi:proteasome inhibitor PI31 subunit [Ambystoma mexicanum]|uniref:proteasome inhibitor PI31 subunit n=1 Tax=Ambystoma mexicanum TaxID=8296 RepID=UPI0037E89D08
MAPGLQLLFASVSNELTVPQDALICFVHWELVSKGYGCLGTGDKPAPNETKSELLPSGWNTDKELYTLRYRSMDDTKEILLKAIMVESSMIINAMDPKLEQVVDLTLNVEDYIDQDNLQNFHSVFKKSDELSRQLLSTIISPFSSKSEKPKAEEEFLTRENPRGYDPLRIPPRNPQPSGHPSRINPLNPFAAGGADLDPISGRSGGMIVDPLRSGFPRSGFDPSSGIPGRLPPGSVPPGARFDPFGPPGSRGAGPDPDHLPPPGYDDMFM